MPDVTGRPESSHHAVAEADVEMSQETLSAIVDGTVAKGDVLSVAELAGVVAGKRAADLIPLVHQTPLTQLLVSATPDRAAGAVKVRAETAAYGPNGVEMAAMTAASVAALTVYDMIRHMEPGALVRSVRLISTSDGIEDEWRRPGVPAEPVRLQKGFRVAGRIAPSPQRPGGTFGPPQRKRTP
jgi:cyclic pyranopterin phosphate synthase